MRVGVPLVFEFARKIISPAASELETTSPLLIGIMSMLSPPPVGRNMPVILASDLKTKVASVSLALSSTSAS